MRERERELNMLIQYKSTLSHVWGGHGFFFFERERKRESCAKFKLIQYKSTLFHEGERVHGFFSLLFCFCIFLFFLLKWEEDQKQIYICLLLLFSPLFKTITSSSNKSSQNNTFYIEGWSHSCRARKGKE